MITHDLLIQHLSQSGLLGDKDLAAAFAAIDRKDFVPQEWRQEAYGDYPLPIGYGQTISQPTTVAFMLGLLESKPGQKILDIGSGSGWTTALLAHVVSQEGNSKHQETNPKQNSETQASKNGKVVSVEIISELVEFGKQNVAKYNFLEKGLVSYVSGSGAKGYVAEAPFDRILVSAAARRLPKQLAAQLAVGGILVMPVKNTIVQVKKVSRKETQTRTFEGFAFVPFVE